MESELENWKNNGKYLPIGSVVLLNGGKRRVMVAGYKSLTDGEKPNEILEWDYCGCIFPEGLLSSEQNLLFNHSQIEKIYCIGYFDEEARNFHEALKKIN